MSYVVFAVKFDKTFVNFCMKSTLPLIKFL